MINKAKWFGVISLSLLLTVLLATCGIPNVKVECNFPNSENKTSATDKQSENIAIEIQVDGTLSMQGFVNNPNQSRYEQTLDLLDKVAASSWSKDKTNISYYKFGTTRNGIGKQIYIQAQTPNFYGGGGVYKDGQVKAAIPPSSANKLSLIVTDLYQTDNDISSVIKQVKQDYFQKDYAVGILGIKSEFNGKVYDIGVRKDLRSYNTASKKPEQLRPFYVIFLGSYENIKYYFEQLKKQGGDLINQDQFIIFSPKVIEQSSSFSLELFPPEMPKQQKTVRKITNLNNGEVIGKIVDKESTEALLIEGKSDNTYSIGQTISYYPSPYTLPVDFSQSDAFTTQFGVEVYDKKAKQFQSSDSQGLQLTDWQIIPEEKAQKLTFNTQVIPNQIQSGIYIYSLSLIPNQLKEPDWWVKWNFDEANFDRNNVNKFDGSTTLNLQSFLRSLKSITTELIETNSPAAAHLCYGVQRN